MNSTKNDPFQLGAVRVIPKIKKINIKGVLPGVAPFQLFVNFL